MIHSNEYMDTIAATLGDGWSAFPVHTGGGCTAFYVGRGEWHGEGLGILITDTDANAPGWPLEDDGDPAASAVMVGVTSAAWAVSEDRPTLWRWDSCYEGVFEIPADTTRPGGWPDPARVARLVREYGDRLASVASAFGDADAGDIANDATAAMRAAYADLI